jgi:hypothetical protein
VFACLPWWRWRARARARAVRDESLRRLVASVDEMARGNGSR